MRAHHQHPSSPFLLITMPFYPLPSKSRKNKQPTPESDSDSSVDERGNVKNLIDYDYDESASSLERSPRTTPRTTNKKQVPQVPQVPLVKTKKGVVSEDTTDDELPPRRAKKIAEKRIRRAIAAGDMDTASSSSTPTKNGTPRIIIEEIRLTPNKKRIRPIPEDDESDASDASESEPRRRRQRRSERNIRKNRREESEESEDEDYEEEESDDEDSYDEESDSDDNHSAYNKILNLLGGIEDEEDPRKPKKYNLKKESANVRRFVELVNTEADGEEDNIDNDITYFKSLNTEKQLALMKVLETKASPHDIQVPLKFKILERVANYPDLSRIAMAKYNALMNIDPSSTEYYKCSHWINGFTNIPLGVYKDLPVKIEDGPERCQSFMENVHKNMEAAVYGHDDAKLQILQFVSQWIANPTAHGNVLSIHGPPGIGKTSLIKDGVAKALDRPFHFISLGGATDASFLDGHSYTYEGSTWGKIVDVLIQSKCMNPVIYFDELDKVSQTPKGDEIMNLLIHLTDGSQNDRFQDKYFTGINLDLSRCLFIFSHNNHELVNPILRDRMYNISLSGFNTKQKLHIAENYLVQSAMKSVGLHEKVSISSDVLRYIVEHYTGGEQGVRELKRCIQTVISKINLLRFFNNPKQVPWAIHGFSLPFTVNQGHLEKFLKRKDDLDPSIAYMYI